MAELSVVAKMFAARQAAKNLGQQAGLKAEREMNEKGTFAVRKMFAHTLLCSSRGCTLRKFQAYYWFRAGGF